ncbi:MAG: OmpA family protein, partial [Saprospiraceae bacterium]|nr:OmpA family protein [Saprospiraceae bacterium]MCB0682954.1 OmpA family protein [Saprospiraceae bacterium]
LTSDIQRKDSLNLALVTNLKRSLANVNDEDIQIEVKKGVVYVSLSDKMLFKSGSDQINSRAEEVLGKVAKVINDHKGIEILVEGHTDSVPIKNDRIRDNWDLSVLRATAVVRNLQTKHGVDPARMTAGGRSEYLP